MLYIQKKCNKKNQMIQQNLIGSNLETTEFTFIIQYTLSKYLNSANCVPEKGLCIQNDHLTYLTKVSKILQNDTLSDLNSALKCVSNRNRIIITTRINVMD